MDKDVQARLERLCRRYQNVNAALVMTRPVKLPSTKEGHRLDRRAGTMITQLRALRGPDTVAVVKLAYVRSLRELVPKARLDAGAQSEVRDLVIRLHHSLNTIESMALVDFQNHTRQLRLANQLAGPQVNERVVGHIRDRYAVPYPLEQRARASVRSIVEMASIAGALAGTSSGSYDTSSNGT